ncbi:MAG: LytTR family DNA-binding domain-containing protein [Prevotella sp.]|jgi:two-component system LytT family response regulator|nr:LytTR family DNA-binding domain-containing protein [Prevotella sp.]MCI1282394.1 LytTR family DNA-binding domain-containing protein [Prevotella sp.]
MTKIKCLAIDDEPLALQQLAAYIKKVSFLELIAECQSALDATKVMEKEPVDAIFCDINMPDLNGMDFVKGLSSPPIVVFSTAYSDYAIEGYKVDAVDYLLKPFSLDDFKQAANRVKKQFELENQKQSAVSLLDKDDALFFKTEHRIVRVLIKDIKYVEGMSEYLRILFDDKKPLVVLLSMKVLEERLPSNRFMRIHRSYIVNLSRIQEINKNRVILDSETYLPIGDLYRDTFNKYIESKFLGK